MHDDDDDDDDDESDDDPSPSEQRIREGRTADLHERLRKLEEDFHHLHGQIDAEQLEQLIAYLEWLTNDPTLNARPTDSAAVYDDLAAADDLKLAWGRLEGARGEALEFMELSDHHELFRDIDSTLDIYEKNIKIAADMLHGPKLDKIAAKISNTDTANQYVNWKNDRPSWRLSNLDTLFPGNHLQSISGLASLLKTLNTYEASTWGEIEQMPHCHPWHSTSDWEHDARARLQSQGLHQKEGWWQLRGGNMQRIFGYREGSVFNIVWHDLKHSIYRTKAGKK